MENELSTKKYTSEEAKIRFRELVQIEKDKRNANIISLSKQIEERVLVAATLIFDDRIIIMEVEEDISIPMISILIDGKESISILNNYLQNDYGVFADTDEMRLRFATYGYVDGHDTFDIGEEERLIQLLINVLVHYEPKKRG